MFYTYEDNGKLRIILRVEVTFIVLISLAWFIVYGFMGQTIVNGQSMSPVLNSEDVCLINRLKYDLSDPDRYDIVLFEREDGEYNIKRVIGLPGETVAIMDGGVYIDGVRLEDERLKSISLAGIAENGVFLGEDEYFVLGDNAESSEDSRFGSIGNVKRQNIRGEIWFKIRPLSELGTVK